MVCALRPVASVIRCAARPVGAPRVMLMFLSFRMVTSALSRVVLPVPGPPVMMESLCWSARSMPSICSGAKEKPVWPWIHSMALGRGFEVIR
jgi:hypothetical protein